PQRLQEPDARVDRLDAAALALAHCTNTNELAYGQYTPIPGGSASPFHGVISALRWLTAPRSSRAATALKYRRARPCCRRDSTPATSCPIAAARASAAPAAAPSAKAASTMGTGARAICRRTIRRRA